ncbi:MAG TPA: protein kinase [Kofleriaceae bacterium]|nr:protein kinase [Kofleriaceae bacterium]
MPGCPRCGQQWPDGYDRCPNDGMSLYPHQAGGAAPELAPQSDEDLPPGSLAGEYRIEKKIGEGGMGSVYGAKHPLIGKRAAIKVIRRELSTSREAVDRFVLEAQSVNQIGHPNIVDVFGFGQLPDGRSFFVMEWLEGESLRDRLQRPLQFPEALEILEHIAKALQAAHEAGVVHRDLKPDNVFLAARKGEKPSVKLLDFGLAKLTGSGETGRFNQTRTGVVMGTPLYLSPEQAKGMKIDAATDVYSLGAMAYEMLSGAVPFKADSAVEIMAMHISAPARPLIEKAPWVPMEINNLVLAMLDKHPQNRPITAQVREQLAACRQTAGAVTIGMAIHPSSQPPPWTPQYPQSPQMTPQLPQTTAQSPRPGAPPSMTPASGPYGVATPGVTLAPPAASAGRKNMALILGVLVIAGAGLGVGAWLAFGNKKTSASASETPSKVEVATNDPGSAASPTPAPPAETKPALAKPAEAKPAEAKPDEAKPAEAKPDTTSPDTTKPDTTKPDTTKPDTTKPDTTKPADVARKSKPGHVTVTFSGPPKAMVIVDGKPVGREAGDHVGLDLAPGDHTIRVQAKGFKPAEEKVHVSAGGSADLKLTLERKKKAVNAVENPFDD